MTIHHIIPKEKVTSWNPVKALSPAQWLFPLSYLTCDTSNMRLACRFRSSHSTCVCICMRLEYENYEIASSLFQALLERIIECLGIWLGFLYMIVMLMLTDCVLP